MNPPGFSFQVQAVDPSTSARRGTFHTPHGPVETPAFMPVGTQGTVKGLTVDMLRATGTQMILANTYHLALRPGEDVVARPGRAARLLGLERTDPHRQRRLPALQPGAQYPRSPRRRPSSARTSTATCSSCRPSGPWRFKRRWAATWRWCWTTSWRCPTSRRWCATPWSAPSAGPGVAQQAQTRAGPGAVRDRAGRARRADCASSAPSGSPSWTFPATPSAV